MKLPRFLSLLAAVLLPLSSAQAFCVYNRTPRTFHVTMLSGGALDQNAPANGQACNAVVGANVNVRVRISSLDSDPIDFESEISGKGGGYVEVVTEDRSALGVPDNIILKSYDQNGAPLFTSARGLGATARDVRFIVTGDGQFNTEGDDAVRVNAMQTLSSMIQRIRSEPSLRGLIYAGDMTQFASEQEIAWQKEAFDGLDRFVFVGLGNHDTPPEYPDRWDRMPPYVLNTKRETVKTRKGPSVEQPHYSWDWHDVHFVQLNLYPGNVRDTNNAGGVAADPRFALDFLSQDLAANVGDSGRPVVLIHHFGLDEFSLRSSARWWQNWEILAYWNVMTNYNVISLFTGHVHLEGIDVPLVDFYRPLGATGGPDRIPDFVAGAALNHVFLEVTIDDSDRMTVVKYDQGSVANPIPFTFVQTNLSRKIIPVVSTSSGTGGNPYNSAIAAHAAAARINSACGTASRTLRFEGGQYSGAVRFNQPRLRLTARNDVARISNP